MKKLETSVEAVDIDSAIRAYDNNRFYLVLGATQRAKEISNQRTLAERAGDRTKYLHRATVQSLIDIAEGRVGKEYLEKLA